MKKFLAVSMLALFALTTSVPATAAVPAEDPAPITFNPGEVEYSTASDGSLVPTSELAAYEAGLASGEIVPPEAFETPVAVDPQPGDPVAFETPLPDTTAPEDLPTVFGPETVYVTASDGSLVPESELAGYEAWLAAGNSGPTIEPAPAPRGAAPATPATPGVAPAVPATPAAPNCR